MKFGGLFFFWSYEHPYFSVLFFWRLGVFNFLLVILRAFILFFSKGDWVFGFHFVNFGGCFVFIKKIRGSSIFFLSFWGSLKKKLCERGGGGGRGCFVIFNFNSFSILKFGSLQFFFLTFCGSLNFLCAKFHKGGEGVFAFLLVNFDGFLFDILKLWSFQFSFYYFGVFKFFVWSFTREEKGYLPFFLWTLMVLCFGILKFWSFQVDGMNKYPLVLGN